MLLNNFHRIQRIVNRLIYLDGHIYLFIVLMLAMMFHCNESSAIGDENGKIRRYGAAIKTISTYAGLFMRDEQGNKIYFGVTRSGNYCRLFRFNVAADVVDMIVPIYGAKGAWAIKLHEKSLYIGTYNPASLYRYNTQTHSLSHIATFEHEKFIWDMIIHDGTLYMGTYPHARLVCYNFKTKEIHDCGSISEEKYIRSLAADGDTIYAGIGARAQLIAYNIRTGISENILPKEFSQDSFVYHQTICDGKLFIGLRPSYNIVLYDLHTGKFELIMESVNKNAGISKPTFSEHVIHFNGIWGFMFEYDRRKNVLKKLASVSEQDMLIDTHIVGKSFLAGMDARGFYDEISFDGRLIRRTNLMTSGLPGIPSIPFSLVAHEGIVFIGERSLRTFDIRTKRETYNVVLGEPKTMCILNDFLYTANYPGATLWRYPIATLIDPGNNYCDNSDRFMILDIGVCQNRPRKIVSHQETNSLLIGTQPDKGKYGGAVTYFNETSKESYTTKNIVPNHSICEITFDRGKHEIAYIGSSAYGGNGTDVLQENAHVIKWDIRRKSILFDVIPEMNNKRILSLAHSKSSLYAVTSNRHLILMNSESGKVLAKNESIGIKKILMTVDECLYGISGNCFYRFDSNTLNADCLFNAVENFRDFTEDKTSREIFLVDGYDLVSYTKSR